MIAIISILIIAIILIVIIAILLIAEYSAEGGAVDRGCSG